MFVSVSPTMRLVIVKVLESEDSSICCVLRTLPLILYVISSARSFTYRGGSAGGHIRLSPHCPGCNPLLGQTQALLPFKHEDVGLISTRALHGQRLEVRRKLDLLSAIGFAVALLVGQLEGVLV
jgi:hypothetical protein